MTRTSCRPSGGQLKLSALSAALAAALSLQGCGGDDLCTGPFCFTPPSRPEATKIEPGPGNGQMGAPGRPLPHPVDVVVTDEEGRPVQDVLVSFTAAAGNLSAPQARSDAQGRAQVTWILGTEPGTQTVEAAADGPSGPLENSPLTLSAQAVRLPPASIVIRQEPPEAARNGVPFEQQPVLEVLDEESQPVPGIEVIASIGSGGGTLSGTTAVSSDATGQVTYTNLGISGVSGPRTLRFSVAAPALEVASRIIQLSAGTPVTMAGVEPLTYDATVNSPVSPDPSVVVRDEAGNGVPGVQVTFTPNRNGSVSPETATTNEQGIAQVSWTLGSTANVQYSLTARVESSAIPIVRFTATARAGAAGRLRIEVQPSSPTQSGTAFAQQPVIQVVDQAGNPTQQSGLTVRATISSGPTGELQNASATTDAAGRAAFTGLTLTGAVGNYALSFSAPGLTGATSVPVTLTVGPAARLAFTVVPSTAARSRMPLVIQPVLQIQDVSGNPVAQSGTQVVVSASPEGTTLTGETATTDENGRAAFTALIITGIPGPKDLTFAVPGLQSVSARVTLPSVETVSATPSHPASAVVGTTVAGPVITWTFRDASTRPVADANFTLLLPSGGTAATLTPFSDANGAVQVGDWTLGPTAGYQYLELKLPDGRSFRDSILATPDVAADLVKVSGDDPIQSAPTGSVLPQLFVVRVVDRHGNGVPNITVQWSTCDGVAGDAIVTDANGYSGTSQPTGTEPSGEQPFCTRASVAIPELTKSVDFQYLVTAASAEEEQPQGISEADSRHSGPPPVAPSKSRLRPSR
jgi:hypothetical protein